jgi:hypothetical protein
MAISCQPYALAVLYPQEDSWYSFLLEVEPKLRLEGLGQLKKKTPHRDSLCLNQLRYRVPRIK